MTTCFWAPAVVFLYSIADYFENASAVRAVGRCAYRYVLSSLVFLLHIAARVVASIGAFPGSG